MSPNPLLLLVLRTRLLFTVGLTGLILSCWHLPVSAASGDPYLIQDINPAGRSNPDNLFKVNGVLFFTAEEGTHGRELWTLNADATSALLLKDIIPGDGSPVFQTMDAFNNLLYFVVAVPNQDGTLPQTQLWKSNGTPEGTLLVAKLSTGTEAGVRKVFIHNDKLYFWIVRQVMENNLPTIHGDLWVSDGSTSGTILLGDLGIASTGRPINPQFVGDTVYLLLESAVFDTNNQFVRTYNLWKSNGTVASTVKVRQWTALPDSQGFMCETANSSTFFFQLSEGMRDPSSLSYIGVWWQSDGTANGTHPLRTATGDATINVVYGLCGAVVNNQLILPGFHGRSEPELWKSDGTTAGTTFLKNIPWPYFGFHWNGQLYFTSSPYGQPTILWRTDGTVNGTAIAYGANFGSSWLNKNRLYFTWTNGGSDGAFWSSDGVTSSQLKNFVPFGADTVGCCHATKYGVLMTALTYAQGTELWKSDGTAAGTQLVKDIYPGGPSGSPWDFVNVGDFTYFRTYDGVNLRGALWMTDGSETGTKLVKGFVTAPNDYFPGGPFSVEYKGKLVFVYYEPTANRELWAVAPPTSQVPTATPTNTPIPPTATTTPLPPTATFTPSKTPLPPTATVPASTATATKTTVPPTPTPTTVAPTATPSITPATNKATIIINKDASPDSIQNFTFYGPFGRFLLDDALPDDNDGVARSISYSVNSGIYNVSEASQSSWSLSAIICSNPAKASVNLSQRSVSITVVAGDVITCTFVNKRKVIVQATLFHDLNGDSQRQTDEPALSALRLRLFDSQSTNLGAVESDANGTVTFADIGADTYRLCSENAVGWRSTIALPVEPSLAMTCHTLTLEDGQIARVSIGQVAADQSASNLFFDPASVVTITALPDIDEPIEDETTQSNRVFLPFVSR